MNERAAVTPREQPSIFARLGFDAAEVRRLELRSEMMQYIKREIEANHWSQAEAATRLRVHQPRINDLLSGKLQKFSVQALMDMLACLEFRVSVTIEKTPTSSHDWTTVPSPDVRRMTDWTIDEAPLRARNDEPRSSTAA